MITFTGIHVTKEFGAPSIQDLAVQLMRLPRYCGATESDKILIWPVGMHSLLVAELLPPAMKVHGLLHDAGEAVINDVPAPMKVGDQKLLEHQVESRIYALLGVAPMTSSEQAMVKAADTKALLVEGWAGCGPRGFVDTEGRYLVESGDLHLGRKTIRALLENWDPMECLRPTGRWPREYEGALRRALRDYRRERPICTES